MIFGVFLSCQDTARWRWMALFHLFSLFLRGCGEDDLGGNGTGEFGAGQDGTKLCVIPMSYTAWDATGP
jgi:hypothetical protein